MCNAIIDDDVPRGFLPFGSAHGDSRVPTSDDGSTGEIYLETDIIFFGSRQNRLYVSCTLFKLYIFEIITIQVNTNGVLSFGRSFTDFSSNGFSFNSVLSSPPIIAPFWDDININNGGTIYYRQDSSSFVANQVQQEIYTQYPNIGFFYPSLVFVATWDRVAAFSDTFEGLLNTFQATIASDGNRTFVRFIYGDIQWGGSSTLIGVSAGDQINFITHPASLSSSVLLLDNTTTTYSKFCDYVCFNYSVEWKLFLSDFSITVPPFECSVEGQVLPDFNNTSDGVLGRFEGTFEICIERLYGSVCDVGWNQEAAQTLCHSQFGSRYGKSYYDLYSINILKCINSYII